jgi:hypothetical protein
MKRVIFCGSRDGYDAQVIYADLVRLARAGPFVVVHGDARGVDRMADGIARSLGIPTEPHPARWKETGRAAGHVRNQHMLDLGADVVFAYKIGFDHELRRGGTEHMVRIARQAGVPTVVST